MLKLLIKDSLLYSISTFLSKGIGFILLPFYTNIFSPSDYGVMDLIAIIVVLVNNLFSLQTNQSLTRYYSDTRSSIKRKSYFTTIFIYYFIIYFFISLILILYSVEVSYLVFNSNEYDKIIILAALNIFFGSLFYIGSNLYRLDFESKKFTILSIMHVVISTSFILIAILILKIGIIGVFIGQLFSYIILLLYISNKIYTKIYFKLFSFKILKIMFRFGIPLVPTVLILLGMQYIDRIMISNMIDLNSLGEYAVAMKISSIIGLLLSGFQLAFGPYVFSNYENPKTKEIISLLFYSINVLSLIIVSFLMIYSYDILLLLTTTSYTEGYKLIPLLALSTFLFSLGGYFSIGFAIANKNEIQTVIYLFIVIINIILNYFLIKAYGITGASIATMVSFLISAILNLSISQKYYNIKYNIKKLSFYIVFFCFISILYYTIIKNTISIEDYILKFVILFLWSIPIYLLEKKSINQLYLFIKNRRKNV